MKSKRKKISGVGVRGGRTRKAEVQLIIFIDRKKVPDLSWTLPRLLGGDSNYLRIFCFKSQKIQGNKMFFSTYIAYLGLSFLINAT